MPVVRAGEIDINYRIAGHGTETVVLVNGLGDDLDAWAPQVDDFVDAGLRLVTFDNRGVGASSHPRGPYTSRQMAQDARALAGVLGLPPFHLAGVSMGGVIAQEYAVAYPGDLRSVILANTYSVADPFTAAAFNTWGLVAETAGMAVMTQQMAPWIYSPDFYAREPEKVAALLVEMMKTTQPVESFLAQTAALVDHDCSDRAGSIETPALVIAASDDIIIRPALSRRLHAALPRATWVEVPGGHAAFWENPRPWNQAVIEFVRTQSATTLT
jgi:pimeloyl-ACP methyl ester carboxylesterase